mgnify:CR=1 FL=1
MIARWFWREWRSPSLLIVWLALSLAVACVLALGNISDRMEKGLSQQSREFMAGDRALRSSREVQQAWLEEAQKRGLKVGKQLTFATMTFAGDTPQLANVKAVDDIYPMYGDLQTNPPGLKPQAGSVLLAPRLMALLNLKTGDTIDVGDATLRIAGEVIQEPDSGFNPFQMAPRLMMNLADVDKTGAVQPGSRVTWRYKFGGNENQLDGYEKWLLPQLKPEQRWYGLEQDEGALGRSIERSQQFLLLSALLTLLLAVAAGRLRVLELLLWPYVTAIKSVPVASFIIICLIWMSTRQLAVFISFLMVFPVIYSNTLQGIKSADGALLEMARVYRVPFSRRLGYIYAPQVKPFLLSGCSVALGMSWKSGVAAEVIGVVGGSIGERLYEAKVYFQMTDLLAWTVVIVVCSVGFEKLVLWLLRRCFAAWEGR